MGVVLNIFVLVAAAYALFFLYDWMTVKRPNARFSSALFFGAFALNAVAVIVLLVNQLSGASFDPLFVAAMICALACFALLIWSLFFALPKGTYVDPEAGRPCYKQGMYALCRHPGVLWYCLLFAFLACALRTPEALACCAILCAGDVAYMLLQDIWTFPATFSDYDAYRATTPLFLPNPASVNLALRGAGEGRC